MDDVRAELPRPKPARPEAGCSRKAPATAKAQIADPPILSLPAARWLAAAALGVSGFASLTLQVVWTRLLVQILGPDHLRLQHRRRDLHRRHRGRRGDRIADRGADEESRGRPRLRRC